MSRYILVMVACAGLIIFAAALSTVDAASLLNRLERAWVDTHLEEIVAACVVFGGAAATVIGKSRVFALTGMGLIGFGLAFFFAVFSAPDVAMTQILVEVLSVTLTVFLITWLPEKSFAAAQGRTTRVIGASGLGLAFTFVALLMGQSQGAIGPVSDFFRENAFSQAHGKNIVNVILVDFRAIDTLGEISVVAAAGIGVLALLGVMARNREEALR